MIARVSQSIIGIDLQGIYDAISTSTPENPALPFSLGMQVEASDGSIWMFVTAGGTVAQYATVGIDVNFSAIAVVGGAAGEAFNKYVGFNQNAQVSSGQSFWAMVSGKPLLRVGDSCAKNAQLYTTDVAGVLDDALGTGSQFPVMGAALSTTVGTAAGSVVVGAQGKAQFPHFGPKSI